MNLHILGVDINVYVEWRRRCKLKSERKRSKRQSERGVREILSVSTMSPGAVHLQVDFMDWGGDTNDLATVDPISRAGKP